MWRIWRMCMIYQLDPAEHMILENMDNLEDVDDVGEFGGCVDCGGC